MPVSMRGAVCSNRMSSAGCHITRCLFAVILFSMQEFFFIPDTRDNNPGLCSMGMGQVCAGEISQGEKNFFLLIIRDLESLEGNCPSQLKAGSSAPLEKTKIRNLTPLPYRRGLKLKLRWAQKFGRFILDESFFRIGLRDMEKY